MATAEGGGRPWVAEVFRQPSRAATHVTAPTTTPVDLALRFAAVLRAAHG